MCSFPSSLSVSVFRISWNLQKPNGSLDCAQKLYRSKERNPLSESAEGVAEGFRGHAEQSLQEYVNLQWVKTFTLIWKRSRKPECVCWKQPPGPSLTISLWCKFRFFSLASDEASKYSKNWPSSSSWFGLGSSFRMARISSLDARFLIAFPIVMATGYPGKEAVWKTANRGCRSKLFRSLTWLTAFWTDFHWVGVQLLLIYEMDNKWRRPIKPSTLKWTYKSSHFHICKYWWVQLGWVLRRWEGRCPLYADGTKACREKRNQKNSVHIDKSTREEKKALNIDIVEGNVGKIPHALLQHLFHKFGFGHFLVCSQTVRPSWTRNDQINRWTRVTAAHLGASTLTSHPSSI